jgi:hypothetical protein
VKGTKSPMERFAGADETFTIEGMMQNGWALQSGTSHFLGQVSLHNIHTIHILYIIIYYTKTSCYSYSTGNS